MLKIFRYTILLLLAILLMGAGCFFDSGNKTAVIASAEVVEDVINLSWKLSNPDGIQRNDGFIQINSSKKLSSSDVITSAITFTGLKLVTPRFWELKNSYSETYTYLLEFQVLSFDIDSLLIEINAKDEKPFKFSVPVIDIAPNSPKISSIDVIGQKASISSDGLVFKGFVFTTKPIFCLYFSEIINPVNTSARVELTNGDFIDCTIDYIENPTILISPNQELQKDVIYNLTISHHSTDIEENIIFYTKKETEIFQAKNYETEISTRIINSEGIFSLNQNSHFVNNLYFQTKISQFVSAHFTDVYFSQLVTLNSLGELDLILLDNKVVNLGVIENSWMVVHLSAADVNNDGFDEIIIADFFGKVRILKITNNLKFTEIFAFDLGFQGNLLTSLTSNDFNNNGLIDFAAGYSNGQIKIYFRSNFASVENVKTVGNINSCVTTLETNDFNRDMNADLAALGVNGNLSVLRNDGLEWKYQRLNVDSKIESMLLFEMNNDGFIDIAVVQDNSSLVFYQNIKSTFCESKLADDHYFNPRSLITSADILGNNYSDLLLFDIVTRDIKIISLSNLEKTRTVETSMLYDVQLNKLPIKINQPINNIASADLNNDRFTDFIVSDSDGISLYFQVSDSKHAKSSVTEKFKKVLTLKKYQNASSLIYDVNADGKLDLIVYSAEEIFFLLNDDFPALQEKQLGFQLDEMEKIRDVKLIKNTDTLKIVILTDSELKIGKIKIGADSEYEFDLSHVLQCTGNSIYPVDFNSDCLTDLIILADDSDLIILSDLTDDNQNIFKIFSEIPAYKPLKILRSNLLCFAKLDKQHLTVLTFSKAGLDIETNKIQDVKSVASKKYIEIIDIEHDGDSDLVALRQIKSFLTADVLKNLNNGKFKRLDALSDKITDLLQDKQLNFVGSFDFNDDGWLETVFCNSSGELFALSIN